MSTKGLYSMNIKGKAIINTNTNIYTNISKEWIAHIGKIVK